MLSLANKGKIHHPNYLAQGIIRSNALGQIQVEPEQIFCDRCLPIMIKRV